MTAKRRKETEKPRQQGSRGSEAAEQKSRKNRKGMIAMAEKQRAFQIESRDNVATALAELEPGQVPLLGDASQAQAKVLEKIPRGHKLALRDIREGEDILKYGVRIARATRDIRAGEWVHLHNIRSVYDERSSHLDVVTGAPKDIRYE